MFEIFKSYYYSCLYTVMGILGWIFFIRINIHPYLFFNILFLLIGTLLLPYGIFRLVDTIIEHVNFKKHGTQERMD